MRLADYFATRASLRPTDLAFIDGDTAISFADASAMIDAIAFALHANKALVGSETPHVAIYSPNDYRVPILQAGVNRADFVFLGVHTRNPAPVNVQILEYFDAELIFFHSRYASVIPELKTSLSKVHTWICMDGQSEYGPSLDDWIAPHRAPYPASPESPLTPAFIVPTGGTTGPSKGVVHTHRSLEMGVITCMEGFDFDPSSRYLAVSPLTHAGGIISLGCAAAGGCSVIMQEFEPGAVLRMIEEQSITHIFIPPTALYSLLAHPDLDKRNVTSLCCVITGAAPTAPEKFREAVQRFGPVIYEGYGQSELGAGLVIKRPSDYLLANGSLDEAGVRAAGRASPFSRVEIMDEEGNLLPSGQAGEIVVISSMSMLGYYKNLEATAEVSTFGWRHTGDVGVRDENGLITIVDRKKDMIISGGFNIYPAQIENVIGSHPAVLECAVVGVPDEKWGEAVKAVVMLKPGQAISAEEVIAHCKAELGSVIAPKSVEFWADLPRSAVGKVLRKDVRAKFWDQEWRAI